MGGQTQCDAIVVEQILGLLRFWPTLEIRWSPNHRHAHVRSDTHGDHVLCHLLAASHPSVKPLGHDIGDAVVDGYLDSDVWILSKELRKFRRMDRAGARAGGRNSNRAGWLIR